MKKMDEAGCDLFLDIHGDEEIPFNFLAGSEGIPSFNERLRDLQNTFSTAFVRASPDFQPKPGYTVDEPGKANLAISSNGVSQAVCVCISWLCCLSVHVKLPSCNSQLEVESCLTVFSSHCASRVVLHQGLSYLQVNSS